MAVKKVSQFPTSPATNTHVFGRTSDNKSVQIPYDIKQTEGDSESSLMSQKAITDVLTALQNRVLVTVAKKTDLLTPDVWPSFNGNTFIFKGMLVSVADDLDDDYATTKPEYTRVHSSGVYRLVDPTNYNSPDYSAWIRVDTPIEGALKRIGKRIYMFSPKLHIYVDTGISGAGGGDIYSITSEDLNYKIINHNLGATPSVTVISGSDYPLKEVECQVEYLTANRIRVTWNSNFIGLIYIV